MSPEQAAQVAQAAFQAPLNNLVAIVAILCICLVGSVIYIAFKFAPIILKQIQQQIDTNQRLTDIADQNTKQVTLNQQSVEKQTVEMSKQTVAIDAQTTEIKAQSLDFRNYQTLVSDNLSTHTTQIEANTASITSLRQAIDDLPKQVIAAVTDKLACEGILKEIQALRYEVSQVLIQQGKRATGSIQAVTSTNGEQG